MCYSPDEHADACPITEMKFVLKSQLDSIEDGYTQVEFNEEKTLLYSKTNLDSLPIMSFEAVEAPCFYLTSPSTTNGYYLLESDRN